MKLKQCNIKVFSLRNTWFFIFTFLRAEEKQCTQFVLQEFQVKVFSPEGRKFLVTKKFVLATKS